MLFIMQYWYLWVIGLILMPIVTILPQIKNILEIIDHTDKNPKAIAKLFLNPRMLVMSIIGGMGTFV